MEKTAFYRPRSNGLCFADPNRKFNYVFEVASVPIHNIGVINLLPIGGETLYGKLDTLEIVPQMDFQIIKDAYPTSKSLDDRSNWVGFSINIPDYCIDQHGRYKIPSLFVWVKYGSVLVNIGKSSHGEENHYMSFATTFFDLSLHTVGITDDHPLSKLDKEPTIMKMLDLIDVKNENDKYEPFFYDVTQGHCIAVGNPDGNGVACIMLLEPALGVDTRKPITRNNGLMWCIRRMAWLMDKRKLPAATL